MDAMFGVLGEGAKAVSGPRRKGPPRWWSRELLVEAVRRFAETRDAAFSQRTFLQATGIGAKQIGRYFEGGWRELLTEARVRGVRWGQREKFPEDELLSAVHRFVEENGRWPTWREFAEATSAGQSTLQRRFGSKVELVRRYDAWRAEREAA